MMNILLDTWATTMWRACWQGGLVVLVVWGVCRLIPSMPARFQCWLWRLAILKFMVVLLLPTLVKLPLLPAPSVALSPMPEVAVQIVTQQVPVSPVKKVEFRPNRTVEVPSLPAILVFLWIIGVGWSLARLLVGWQGARQLRKQGRIIDNIPLIEQLATQARLYGLRTSPALLKAEGDGSPMLIGILRPAIVIPGETLRKLSPSELAMVLGHELAHIRRGDLPWNLAAAGMRALFFFHPLVWLSQRRLNLAQEVAADELAIIRQHHDPVSYGKLLVSAVSKFGPSRLIPTMSMGTAGSVQSLTWRLVAMASIGRASRGVILTSGVLLAATVLLGIVPWRLVAAEPKPDKGLPPPLAINGYGPVPKGGPWLVPEATLPGSEQKQGQQFFAEIQVSRSLKGKPKTALTKAPRMLHGSNFADFSIGDISRCLRVTVGPSSDKKLLEHIIEVKVIHDPKGKNPVVLTAKRITLADGKTGTVSVVEADGSEIEVEATMMKLRTGGWQSDDDVPSFVRTADEAKAIAEIKKLGGKVATDQMPSSEPGFQVILEGTKVTDEGLAHIAGLTRLLTLSLDGSQVTDAGLAHIAGLTELWNVSLGDTQVTDAGLAHLVGLKKLRGLSLTGTQVTDAGLKHLAGLTQLQSLSLDDTKVTDAGVTKLRKALPKCEIVWP